MNKKGLTILKEILLYEIQNKNKTITLINSEIRTLFYDKLKYAYDDINNYVGLLAWVNDSNKYMYADYFIPNRMRIHSSVSIILDQYPHANNDNIVLHVDTRQLLNELRICTSTAEFAQFPELDYLLSFGELLQVKFMRKFIKTKNLKKEFDALFKRYESDIDKFLTALLNAAEEDFQYYLYTIVYDPKNPSATVNELSGLFQTIFKEAKNVVFN